MKWQADSNAQKQIKKIVDALKNDNDLILATDPDREGEAIAAHLAEEVSNNSISRVQFTEITKEGIIEGMEQRHEVDQHLVNAQYTRRVIDRLVGYKLSRLLKVVLHCIIIIPQRIAFCDYL